MINIKDQCTTLGQSKRLLELGFRKDSASLEWEGYQRIGRTKIELWGICFGGGMHPDAMRQTLPCWSIADMMKILHESSGFSLDALGQISIYLADEPCKLVVGHSITVHDDYSLLRDNFFEALVALKEGEL